MIVVVAPVSVTTRRTIPTAIVSGTITTLVMAASLTIIMMPRIIAIRVVKRTLTISGLLGVVVDIFVLEGTF